MEIYSSRVILADGTEEMEFLDSRPTFSFTDGLFDAVKKGDIQFFSIRVGNLNGGDSSILMTSED